MKNIKLLCIALFLFSIDGFAQTVDYSLVPYRSGNNWGFSNVSQKIVIPANYDEVTWFSEGFAAVRKGSKWGYINEAGKLVIPLKFTVANAFRKGYLPNDKKDGGDSVLFAGASLQADGYEICINTKGLRMPICPAIPENSLPENNIPVKTVKEVKNYSLPNNQGLFDKIVDDYVVPGSNEKYYIAVKDNKYGVFNSKFDTIVPFQYSNLSTINIGGNTYLRIANYNNLGLLNALGKQIIAPQYSNLIEVNGNDGKGYIIVQQGGKYFVKDLQQNDVIATGFAYISYDGNKGFVVTDENNLKGYYFMDGKNIAPKYAEIKGINDGNYILVKTTSGKTGYVNAKGEEYFVQ